MSGLNKAVEKILGSAEEHAFSKIYAQLPDKLKKELDIDQLGSILKQHLLQAGSTTKAVSYSNEKVVSRQVLFANCAFRIQLTAIELENRQLIIGHRLLPFVHPGIPVEELRFFDAQDRPLAVIREMVPISPSTSIFFNLLPPYGIMQYLGEDDSVQTLYLAMVDLDAWLIAEDFSLEDQILVSVKNKEKQEFYLEKLSAREINSLRLTDRYYEKMLTEAIYLISKILGKSFLPVDMHLFWAFAQLEPHLIENAGTPFGPFISQHNNLTFFQEGPYAFLQHKNFMDELMESAMQHAQHPAEVKMGVATGLDGIFQELGNSFSRLLLKACMVEQVLEWDEVNEEQLHVQMFGDLAQPFFNARQEKHFKQAFNRLLKSVQEKWADKELALPHLQLLRKAIQFKMEIIQLLRKLNKINDPQQLNMQALLQLQPIDQSLDHILENILSKKPMPYQEAQTLVKQLDSGREKFLLFRDDMLTDL